MGVFKEQEIMRIQEEENLKASINFNVAQMFDRVRKSQTHLKAVRRREFKEQMDLLKERYQKSSGF